MFVIVVGCFRIDAGVLMIPDAQIVQYTYCNLFLLVSQTTDLIAIDVVVVVFFLRMVRTIHMYFRGCFDRVYKFLSVKL